MQMDGMKEFIIVEADGINTLAGVGGNFYTNSPVTGNAEDFVTKDLVSYIDGTYRTVAKASARGLSGFSMGGSGTINVGLKHPDLYAALYANPPGLLAESGGLKDFLASSGSWTAYSVAYFPDMSVSFPHARPIKAHDPLETQDPALVKLWDSGYGNLRQKVADYLAQPERLKEIKVAYGTGDNYKWIPAGAEYFLGVLQENGISSSSHVFGGAHRRQLLLRPGLCRIPLEEPDELTGTDDAGRHPLPRVTACVVGHPARAGSARVRKPCRSLSRRPRPPNPESRSQCPAWQQADRCSSGWPPSPCRSYR